MFRVVNMIHVGCVIQMPQFRLDSDHGHYHGTDMLANRKILAAMTTGGTVEELSFITAKCHICPDGAAGMQPAHIRFSI